tara:strand:+ start:1581 stop:1790 length:210 start_codon:yes stop_codon:yes gene_type:complete
MTPQQIEINVAILKDIIQDLKQGNFKNFSAVAHALDGVVQHLELEREKLQHVEAQVNTATWPWATIRDK